MGPTINKKRIFHPCYRAVYLNKSFIKIPLFVEGEVEIVSERTAEHKNIIITIITAFKKQFLERGKWQNKLNCVDVGGLAGERVSEQGVGKDEGFITASLFNRNFLTIIFRSDSLFRLRVFRTLAEVH